MATVKRHEQARAGLAERWPRVLICLADVAAVDWRIGRIDIDSLAQNRPQSV